MNRAPTPLATSPTLSPPRRGFRWRWLFLGVFAAFALFVVALVLSFLPAGEARAIRSAVASASDHKFDQKISFGVGWPVLGLGRLIAGFTDLNEDARAAFRSVRRADVSIQELQEPIRREDRQAMLAAADRAMDRRGWDRIVGVIEEDEVVGIYVPQGDASVKNLKIAVFVLEGREMVVVSARCDLEPLLEIIERHGGMQGHGLLGMAR